MKKYTTVLVVSLIMIIGIAAIFIITRPKDKSQERIEYVLDLQHISDEVMDDMVLIPEVVIPEDVAFWFYRFHGAKSYATFYNDMYNLTFQDFGDSLDLQFEFFDEGLKEYADGKVEYYKKEANTLMWLIVIFSCIAFLSGYFLNYILKRLNVEKK